jgi:hypothetical protein
MYGVDGFDVHRVLEEKLSPSENFGGQFGDLPGSQSSQSGILSVLST